MTTKYDPPSVDDTGPSFTSEEIYDSEVGKKFTEVLNEQRIEKCFEEIVSSLRRHNCIIDSFDNTYMSIHDRENSNIEIELDMGKIFNGTEQR